MGWPVRMMLYIALLTLPLYIYLFLRLRTSLQDINSKYKLSRWWILLPIVFVNLAPATALFSYLTGNIDGLHIYGNSVGWQDYVLYYPFWWGVIFLLESVFYFLLADLFLVIAKLSGVKNKNQWRNRISKTKLLIVLFFLIYVPVKTHFDTNTVRTKNYSLDITDLAPELHGMDVGLIADVQVDRYTNGEKLDKFIHQYKNLQSDMILFAGDIVTSGKTYIEKALETLCGQKAALGNYACMGDHDYWADPQSIENGLLNCGWDFIQNQHRIINYNTKKILITGITHVYSRRISRDNAEKIFASAPPADLKIVLVHQPAEFLVELAEQYDYNLFLAGHTHGGQIVNHIFGFPFTPSAFETDYYSGRYRLGSMHIIVTTGIGLSLAPMRYHAPAEVVNITLQ